MKIQSRSYQNRSDLQAVGALIRRIYQLDPGWNSWSFALYDIWAQRKLGDQEVFEKLDWQQDLRFWESEAGNLLGAAVFRDPGFVKLIVLPEHRDLMSPMMDWVEKRFVEKALPEL